MMRSFLFLLPAAAAVFLCTSCSMLIRQDPPPAQQKQNGGTPSEAGQKPGEEKGGKPLTDRQIGEMTPDELERHMEEKRRRESAQAFSDEMASGKLSERDRRHMRMNVTRPMSPEERGSAFPWKGEPGSRSESLRDSTTFNH